MGIITSTQPETEVNTIYEEKKEDIMSVKLKRYAEDVEFYYNIVIRLLGENPDNITKYKDLNTIVKDALMLIKSNLLLASSVMISNNYKLTLVDILIRLNNTLLRIHDANCHILLKDFSSEDNVSLIEEYKAIFAAFENEINEGLIAGIPYPDYYLDRLYHGYDNIKSFRYKTDTRSQLERFNDLDVYNHLDKLKKLAERIYSSQDTDLRSNLLNEFNIEVSKISS